MAKVKQEYLDLRLFKNEGIFENINKIILNQKRATMITLRMILRLATKYNTCKGNLEIFKKALDSGDTLGCYQITLGNKRWLLNQGIIKRCDLPELERLAQGIGKYYHDNGQIYRRANYKNNKYNGLYEEWYSNGQIYRRANYKNNKYNGLYEEWYSNGQLSIRSNYKNDKRHGLYEYWYSNGQLYIRANYKNNKYNGLYEYWYSNGQLSIRSNYKNGEMYGLSECWYSNGKRAISANGVLDSQLTTDV